MAREVNFTVDTNVLLSEERKCVAKIEATDLPRSGLYCPMVWDGALCWPYVLAGKVYKQPCPDYVQGFNLEEYAFKNCTSSGTWWVPSEGLPPWTNYTPCTIPEHSSYVSSLASYNVSLLELNLPTIRQISRIGYILSLSTLIVAFFILVVIRRLRCRRNRLHLHLFVSFMIRATMFLTEDSRLLVGLMTTGVNISDVRESLPGYTDEVESLPLGCKVFVSIWLYSIMANYSWILMEGLYLHNLIFRALQAATTAITRYVILGWGFPLPFLLAWIVVRSTTEDTLCWTASRNPGYFWIIRGPITAAIIVNFVLFLNITRVIFLKTFSPQSSRHCRYRKWFKSTLVLLPLFGVHYSVTTVMAMATGENGSLELAWLFVDQIFSSFQGSVVAFLYCFLNTEVRAALWNLWQRWKMAHGHIFSLKNHLIGDRSRHNSRQQLSSEEAFGRKHRSVLDRLDHCGAEHNDFTFTVSQNTLSSFVELTENRRDSESDASATPSSESRFTVSAVLEHEDAAAASVPRSPSYDVPVAGEIVLHCSGILVPAILLCSSTLPCQEMSPSPNSSRCCHLVADRYSSWCRMENSSKIWQHSGREKQKHCLCSCTTRCDEYCAHGIGECRPREVNESEPISARDVETFHLPTDRCERQECQEIDAGTVSREDSSEHHHSEMRKHVLYETCIPAKNQLLKERKETHEQMDENGSLPHLLQETAHQTASVVVSKEQPRPRSQSEGSKWLNTFREKTCQGLLQKGSAWSRLRDGSANEVETLPNRLRAHAASMMSEVLEIVTEHVPKSNEQTTLLEKDTEGSSDASMLELHDIRQTECEEKNEGLILQVENSNLVADTLQRNQALGTVQNIPSWVKHLRPRSQSEGSKLLNAMRQQKHGHRWYRANESIRTRDSETSEEFRETLFHCLPHEKESFEYLKQNVQEAWPEKVQTKTTSAADPLQKLDVMSKRRIAAEEQLAMITRNSVSSNHPIPMNLAQKINGHRKNQTTQEHSRSILNQCNPLLETIEMQHPVTNGELNPFKNTDFHYLDFELHPSKVADDNVEKFKSRNPFDCSDLSQQVNFQLSNDPIEGFAEPNISLFQSRNEAQTNVSSSKLLDSTKRRIKQLDLSTTKHATEGKFCVLELKKSEDTVGMGEIFTPNESLQIINSNEVEQKHLPISLIDLSPIEETSALLKEHDPMKQRNSLSTNEIEITNEILHFEDSSLSKQNPFLIYDSQLKKTVNILESNTTYVNEIKNELFPEANPFDDETNQCYCRQLDSPRGLEQQDLSTKANMPDLCSQSKYLTQVKKELAIVNGTEEFTESAPLSLHFDHNDDFFSDFSTKREMAFTTGNRHLDISGDGDFLEAHNPFVVVPDETNHFDFFKEKLPYLPRSSAYNPFIDSPESEKK